MHTVITGGLATKTIFALRHVYLSYAIGLVLESPLRVFRSENQYPLGMPVSPSILRGISLVPLK